MTYPYGRWTCSRPHEVLARRGDSRPYEFYAPTKPAPRCPIAGCGNTDLTFTPMNGVHEMKHCSFFVALWRAAEKWRHFPYA